MAHSIRGEYLARPRRDPISRENDRARLVLRQCQDVGVHPVPRRGETCLAAVIDDPCPPQGR